MDHVTYHDPRHGSGDYWVNEKTGCYRKLQAQATSNPQRKRGRRDDHPVCVDLQSGMAVIYLFSSVDDILRAAPRRREAV
jgi:hypothetical protein